MKPYIEGEIYKFYDGCICRCEISTDTKTEFITLLSKDSRFIGGRFGCHLVTLTLSCTSNTAQDFTLTKKKYKKKYDKNKEKRIP